MDEEYAYLSTLPSVQPICPGPWSAPHCKKDSVAHSHGTRTLKSTSVETQDHVFMLMIGCLATCLAVDICELKDLVEYGDAGGCRWPVAEILLDFLTNCFPRVGNEEDDASVQMMSRAVVNVRNAY